MAKTNPVVEDDLPKEPLFQRFQWHPEELDNAKLPGRNVMEFIGNVRDITAGVKTILELRQRDFMEDGFEDSQKLLGDSHHGNLERLSITALELLNYESEKITNWAYEHHTKEGKEKHGHSNFSSVV